MVNVRLLAANLPSQKSGNESIEALVEVAWKDDIEEQKIWRNALLRLRDLLDSELNRFDQQLLS